MAMFVLTTTLGAKMNVAMMAVDMRYLNEEVVEHYCVVLLIYFLLVAVMTSAALAVAQGHAPLCRLHCHHLYKPLVYCRDLAEGNNSESKYFWEKTNFYSHNMMEQPHPTRFVWLSQELFMCVCTTNSTYLLATFPSAFISARWQ